MNAERHYATDAGWHDFVPGVDVDDPAGHDGKHRWSIEWTDDDE